MLNTDSTTKEIKAPHTPGPWLCENVADREGGIGVFNVKGATYRIAVVPLRLEDGEQEANARLIATAPELLATAKELREALCGAMRVIAGIDTATRMGIEAVDYMQKFVDEMHLIGLEDGFGVRAQAVIAKADPSYADAIAKAAVQS